MRVPYEEMYNEFVRVLLKYGFDKDKAEISAKLYADASRDGVYTHGLNRFPKFIKSIHDGGFKGGKGVLVGAVMLAFFDWRVFAIAFALFILSVVLTKWISLGSILGAVSFPITTWLFYRDPVLTAMAFGMAAAVVFMHRSNIGRILHGTENKFSFKSKKTIEASPDGEEK